MNTDLDTAIAALNVGDYVTVTGTDTRGHDVTRVGTLLAEAKRVTAQRRGLKTEAWRLFVGPEGTDPAVRATWTTLFHDAGSVALAEEPSSEAWTNDSFGSVPGVRLATPGFTFRYGGKGGKRSAEPTEDVTVSVTYTSDGKYELRDVTNGDVVAEVTYARKIWWAPAPRRDEREPVTAPKAELTGREMEEPTRPAAEPKSAELGRARHCVLLRNAISGEEVPFVEHDTITRSLHDAVAGAGSYAAAKGWDGRDTRVVEAVTWSPDEFTRTAPPGLPLIGLAGGARAGKDTAAEALLDAGWQRRAFADRLREFLYAADPLIDGVEVPEFVPLRGEVDRHGWARVKEFSVIVRGLYQRTGTEAGRQIIGDNVWVDALFRDYEAWTRPTVITDVRFRNEAAAIRERGGLIVQIVRPDQKPISEAAHVSENSLAGFPFDAILINDTTPEALGHQLRTYAAAKGILEPAAMKG
ncbi:hypothetical protein [Streptomyces sp. DT117]|uniref:deoxynucleotide monophosphate kinase family protein n=1 Tax=Streptomyces sp. DT117 TaxID=3393422 RepID=UPI003CF83FFB